jgi:hypothetical protein
MVVARDRTTRYNRGPLPLTEEAFTVLVDSGCTGCRSKKLVVDAIVAQRIPLLAGEPFGPPSWGYKGEDLVGGTYRIACDGCKKVLFTATACPRCEAEGGVERALAEESSFPLPKVCASCGSEQLTATAYVPARVVYEGVRAGKARAHAAPDEPGFHAARTDCKRCHAVLERRTPCPVCAGDAARVP